MHLEKNILKGKFGKNKELRKEALEEIEEEREEVKHFKKGKMKSAHEKALSKMKK